MSTVIQFPVATAPSSIEMLWFRFIRAQQARNRGECETGPCEPVVILKALDRLYRSRRIQMDHLLVLRHYGRRGIRPEQCRTREARLWDEGMGELSALLSRDGVITGQEMLGPG